MDKSALLRVEVMKDYSETSTGQNLSKAELSKNGALFALLLIPTILLAACGDEVKAQKGLNCSLSTLVIVDQSKITFEDSSRELIVGMPSDGKMIVTDQANYILVAHKDDESGIKIFQNPRTKKIIFIEENDSGQEVLPLGNADCDKYVEKKMLDNKIKVEFTSVGREDINNK